MKISNLFVAALLSTANAGPLTRQDGSTQFVIGQNYLNEWQDFAEAVKTPAGVSLYGDIWIGALNSDSQQLLEAYAGSHKFDTLFLLEFP